MQLARIQAYKVSTQALPTNYPSQPYSWTSLAGSRPRRNIPEVAGLRPRFTERMSVERHFLFHALLGVASYLPWTFTLVHLTGTGHKANCILW